MSTFKDKLKRARLPQRSKQVCLRGDLVADFEAAERALKEAQESKSDSLEDSIGPIVDRIDRLRQEMLEETEEFRLRAMPGSTFHAFKAAFPPRRDDDGTLNATDAQLGFNTETFFDALLKVSVISPDMGVDVDAYLTALVAGENPVLPDGDWPDLLEVLTDRQYNDLTDVAWFLNRHEVSVPFSSAASLAKRNFGGE